MVLFALDPIIHAKNGVIPSKIYVNKVFADDINNWLIDLANNNLIQEIVTWDGCFNVRKKRGLSSLSLHAFACAVDCNASHNPLGVTRVDALKRGLRPFTEKFIEVSRKHMDCGADWKDRPDGMHFQIKSL